VVVIGEYDRDESQPGFRFETAMGHALWGSAWPRKNPLGERASVLSTTAAQLREIQHRYYVPNNSALIVTGDVRPDSVFAAAQRAFGDWERAPDPFVTWPIPPIPPLRADTGVLVEEPISAAVIMLQWQGPSARGDPAATYAADVFSDLLNSPTSRMHRRLVDTGLFQSLGVNYLTLDHVGPITISGETTPGHVREALTALEKEIALLGDSDYFSSAELEPIKRQRIVADRGNHVRPRACLRIRTSAWFLVGGHRAGLFSRLRGHDGQANHPRPAAVRASLHHRKASCSRRADRRGRE
jgi:zinc protease